MRKLLSASFARLWENTVFWAEIGATVLLSVFIVFVNYSSELQATENRLYLDDVFFTLYLLLGLILAAGISLIVGTEYSDGTIRNKVIVGHTRGQIYFSTLIVCAVTSALVLLIHAGITYGIGYWLFGAFQTPINQIGGAVISAFFVGFVFSALFAAIAMNAQNKAVTAVVTMILFIGLTYLASAIGNALVEPEMTYEGMVISMDGVQFGDMIPNPAYVSGFQRAVYTFLYDLLPTGQLIQMYTLEFAHSICWPVFSVLLFTLITVTGYMIFRKKDIK